MKMLVKSSRLGAVAVAAMLTVAACASSDGATTDADASGDATSESTAASDAPESNDGASTPAAEAGPTVLEVSASLDVAGDPLAPLEDPTSDVAVGLMAPVVTGQQFDGTDITIGGATDGPTMLVFLAHWCPHCNDEIPEIVTLREQGDLPDNLNIIGVSTAVVDDRENYPPSEWLAGKDWTWPVLADTLAADAFQTYGGSGFPFTVMLNADGSVNARKSGNESAAQIKDWIDAALLT